MFHYQNFLCPMTKIYDNLISTVIPISAGGERLGTLLIYKENESIV